ncbi:hypothetical protein ONZ45_g12540 [Pleurotus djamor]|nr:hypothetical protein ONZ45_g12540 [Pleurotus djamor]
MRSILWDRMLRGVELEPRERETNLEDHKRNTTSPQPLTRCSHLSPRNQNPTSLVLPPGCTSQLQLYSPSRSNHLPPPTSVPIPIPALPLGNIKRSRCSSLLSSVMGIVRCGITIREQDVGATRIRAVEEISLSGGGEKAERHRVDNHLHRLRAYALTIGHETIRLVASD